MCQYTYTRYSCGHFHHGVAIGTGSTVCRKCTPVKVALEYWHSQLRYLPIETPTGNTMACPRACRPIRPNSRDVVGEPGEWRYDDRMLDANMLAHGVTPTEVNRILQIENTVGMDSMRALPRNVNPTQDYPIRCYNFIRDLEVYQSLEKKGPNVIYRDDPRGCGCPIYPSLPSPCIANWTFNDILMLRMREWNTPPFTNRFLRVDYGTHVLHYEPRNQSLDRALTEYTIPMSERLFQVSWFIDHGVRIPLLSGHPPPPPPPPPQAAPEAAVSEHSEEGQSPYPAPGRRPSSVPPNLMSSSQETRRSTEEGSDPAQLSEQLAATRLGGAGPSTNPGASFAQSGPDPEDIERFME